MEIILLLSSGAFIDYANVANVQTCVQVLIRQIQFLEVQSSFKNEPFKTNFWRCLLLQRMSGELTNIDQGFDEWNHWIYWSLCILQNKSIHSNLQSMLQTTI